ncbi:MAG: energy transducer TonB [Burkholderiaceae bacterium]|nr:energy transducer TonB [Burkholderiaceae bacterium]
MSVRKHHASLAFNLHPSDEAKAHKSSLSALVLCLISAFILGACQKTPDAPAKTETAASEAETSASMPTGIVQNAVKHTHESADVTKWLDQAGTKSAERLAAEEKQARELKLAQEKAAQEAKAAQETKAAALLAAKARETAKAAPPPPQVVAPKPVEIPVVAPTVTKTSPAPTTTAPEPVVLKLISSVQPKFPIAAAREGLTQGTVTARMFIDTNGSISKVEIVNAQPKKIFDKEVISAALQWKYAPISSPQVNVVQFNFKLDG